MKLLNELPPDALRSLSLEMMREVYDRTLDLQEEMRKELSWWRGHVFKGRLLCLAMFANVTFVVDLTQGSLSRSVDFFLFLNCLSLVVSGSVIFWHFWGCELSWWQFRNTLRKVTKGADEMRDALKEIEKAEHAKQN